MARMVMAKVTEASPQTSELELAVLVARTPDGTRVSSGGTPPPVNELVEIIPHFYLFIYFFSRSPPGQMQRSME